MAPEGAGGLGTGSSVMGPRRSRSDSAALCSEAPCRKVIFLSAEGLLHIKETFWGRASWLHLFHERPEERRRRSCVSAAQGTPAE